MGSRIPETHGSTRATAHARLHAPFLRNCGAIVFVLIPVDPNRLLQGHSMLNWNQCLWEYRGCACSELLAEFVMRKTIIIQREMLNLQPDGEQRVLPTPGLLIT
jgi:hypothetical protein